MARLCRDGGADDPSRNIAAGPPDSRNRRASTPLVLGPSPISRPGGAGPTMKDVKGRKNDSYSFVVVSVPQVVHVGKASLVHDFQEPGDFAGRGQLPFECLQQPLDDAVGRRTSMLTDGVQGIFEEGPVLFLAENDPDGRISSSSRLGGRVPPRLGLLLSRKLRLGFPDLQINGYQTL